MSKQFNRIGNYISVIDNRNSNGEIDKLMGISIDKCYIPSVANVIGTDLKNYKVIRRGQFACSLMQVSRDQRIPIAMYSDKSPAIMSPAYVMFEVNKPDEILPEYMELWFRRAEFDREASFYAVGGVRGSLDWEDFCNMKLPVPSIYEQRRIVNEYQVITERIELLQKTNQAFEEFLYADFQRKFQAGKDNSLKGIPYEGWRVTELSNLTDFQYGKMVPEEDRLEKGYPIFSGYGITGYYHEYMFEDPCIVVLARGVSGTGEVRISPRFSYITNLSIALMLKDDAYFAYLYEYLAHDNLRALDSGSAQSMITIDSLNKYLVAVPPKGVVKEYNRSFHKIRELIEANQNEIALLIQLSSIQLQRLAKGA